MTKVQLILVGGRPMPNILTIVHQKPDVVVAICSLESVHKEWLAQKKAIQNLLPQCKIKEAVVDGYQLRQIREACENAIRGYPNADWIFNITTATTIMSIGAYETAKEYASKMSIKCWYLDTASTRVISLMDDKENPSIFELEVDQYVLVYNRRLINGNLEDERAFCEEHWLPFALLLGKNPQYTVPLKEFVKKIANNKPKKEAGLKQFKLKLSDDIYDVLKEASKVELIHNLRQENGFTHFKLSYLQANFLDGGWLEAYVWEEANSLKVFSDCQWNQIIVDREKPDDKNSQNEFDVSMLYKAQLIIVECKTGTEAFDSQTLYKLDSVANSLGGRFVNRLLVTNLFIVNETKDKNKKAHWKGFNDKAKERGIILITGETLPSVGKELENLVNNLKHSR